MFRYLLQVDGQLFFDKACEGCQGSCRQLVSVSVLATRAAIPAACGCGAHACQLRCYRPPGPQAQVAGLAWFSVQL